MEWDEYLTERINAAPILAREHTKTLLAERAIILRMMSFAKSFQDSVGDSRIIILYGLRGIGKSTIMFQMYNRLRNGQHFGQTTLKKVAQEDILYLSIDQALLSANSESKSPIYDAVKNFCEKIHNQTLESLNKKVYILIDEAQFDKKWAVAAKSIFDASKNIFLVITGSSALALNIDTDTARRAIKEPLFPLSFMEYQLLKNKVFPKKGTSENLKRLILSNDRAVVADLNASIGVIAQQLDKKRLNLKSELQDYLTLGGFPYGIQTSKEIAYRRLTDMINRIVVQDLPEVSNFETSSIPQIMRMIGTIALKPSGSLSQEGISKSIGISAAKVHTIIESLQKTHLIFTVKPFPSVKHSGGVNKGFEYYFMSPTLLCAIKYLNGKTSVTSAETGILWESATASVLHKLCFTSGTIYSLFYDPRRETNVDFLLQNPISGKIIPIEVGLTKDDTQVTSAIEFYKSDYGIVVSDIPEITFSDKIIRIPAWLFFYL